MPLIIILVIVVVIGVAGGYYYTQEKTQKEKASKALTDLENNPPVKPTATSSNTSTGVTPTQPQTHSVTSIAPHGSAKIAPPDVPIYPESHVGAESINKGTYSARISMSSTVLVIREFYKTQLQKYGWVVQSDTETVYPPMDGPGGTLYNITATKDKRHFEIVYNQVFGEIKVVNTDPASFPSDVPAYSGVSIKTNDQPVQKFFTNGKDYTAIVSESRNIFESTMEFDGLLKDVSNFYKTQIRSNGWTVTEEKNEIRQPGNDYSFNSYMARATKPGKLLTVSVIEDYQKGNLLIGLSVQKN